MPHLLQALTGIAWVLAEGAEQAGEGRAFQAVQRVQDLLLPCGEAELVGVAETLPSASPRK